MKKVLTITVLVVLASTCAAQISLSPVNFIPVNFENATVIIEKWNSAGAAVTHGTGFFYGDASSGQAYLVTNRHVLVGHDTLHVRFNNINGTSSQYTLHLVNPEGKPYWRGHPDAGIDLAVVPVPPLEIRIVDSPRLKPDSEVRLGDAVFFMGFPLTESTRDGRVYPLVRHGVVSYITKDIVVAGIPPTVYAAGTILVDATSMGGNSGGPVISTPKNGETRASLIGVVCGHISDAEGNTDLGIVVPASRIPEVIALYGKPQAAQEN